MQALPQDDYEYAEWHLARVGIDYHVEVQGFFYSVPHALIREQVDTRATARTIEVFHRGKRVAAHARRYGGPRHGTLPEHMPSAHRRYAEWTPERLQRRARGIGPNTEALIIAVLARRPHPEQGFRTCLGVLRLFRGIDAARAESGQPARRRDRRADLRLGRLDPQTPARPAGVAASRGRHATAARQHPRLPLLPLRRPTLLTHPTLDLLHDLGLHGMAKGFRDMADNPESAALGHAEWLGILLERESTLRQQKRFESRAKTAKLRHLAAVEDVDYRTPRGLDRTVFLKLAGCDWIRETTSLSPDRAGRRRQVVARLRAGTRPAGRTCPCSISVCRGCLPRWPGPRRWSLRQAAASARPGRSADPR